MIIKFYPYFGKTVTVYVGKKPRGAEEIYKFLIENSQFKFYNYYFPVWQIDRIDNILNGRIEWCKEDYFNEYDYSEFPLTRFIDSFKDHIIYQWELKYKSFEDIIKTCNINVQDFDNRFEFEENLIN